MNSKYNDDMKIACIGGHLSPALAVIDALPKEHTVIFIGRKYATEGEVNESFEYKTIIGRDIPFFNLVTGRFQRSFSRHTVSSLGKIPGGFRKAYEILKKEKPDVVIGFGGYLSVPVCFAAKILRIPVVIHEQTLRAGLANKVVASVASTICLSWESSLAFFPKGKCIVTGNPLKKEIIEVATKKHETNSLPIIYITGGSTGSHVLNEVVSSLLPDLLNTFVIYHQAGNTSNYTSYEKLSEVKLKLSEKQQSRYFLADHYSAGESAEILQKADLVISRAGINTVTELLYLQKPAILVPLLSGQHNEQETNAVFLRDVGLATVIKQTEITPALLFNQIHEMFASISRYTVKKHVSDNERNRMAALKLVEVILHVASNTVSQKAHQTS